MNGFLVDLARRGRGLALGPDGASDSTESAPGAAAPRPVPEVLDGTLELPTDEGRETTDVAAVAAPPPTGPMSDAPRVSGDNRVAAVASRPPAPPIAPSPVTAARAEAAAAGPATAVPAPLASPPPVPANRAPHAVSSLPPATPEPSAPMSSAGEPAPAVQSVPGAPPANPVGSNAIDTGPVIAVARPDADPGQVLAVAAPPVSQSAAVQSPRTPPAAAPMPPAEISEPPATPAAAVQPAIGADAGPIPRPLPALAGPAVAEQAPARVEPTLERDVAPPEPAAAPRRDAVATPAASRPGSVEPVAEPPTTVPARLLVPPIPTAAPASPAAVDAAHAVPMPASVAAARPATATPLPATAQPRPAWLEQPPVVAPAPLPGRSVQVRIGAVEVRAESPTAPAPVAAPIRRSAARGFDDYRAIRSHAGWDL